MGITISHISALDLLRAARVEAGEERVSAVHTDLVPPSLDSGEAWTSLAVARTRQGLGLPESRPLDVLVPSPKNRLRCPGVTNHVWGTEVRGLWFWELEDKGVVIPGPEVLLAQLTEVLSLEELIAVGHELCGAYTLQPSWSPFPAVTGIPAVTSEEQVRDLLKHARNLRGRVALRYAVPRIHDGSCSPQETCLSTMAQLPVERGGYQMGRVDLNVEVAPHPGCERLITTSGRVPDILFHGTKVGLNYDGDIHVDLSPVVRAARELGGNPASDDLRKELDEAIEGVRKDIAADKQRDRDLLAMGYRVLPVTRFDLEKAESLDLVMRQVMELIETETQRDMSLQRQALEDEKLKRRRESILLKLRSL